MELKDTCRLCLSKEGEFYKLFNSSNGESNLADELNCLLDFKIENNAHLPDSICANCYKINSFFKEFRRDCARIKDRLYQPSESANAQIIVKLEKIDCEDTLSGDRTSTKSTTVNPHDRHTALHVEKLRSSFHDAIVSGGNKTTIDDTNQSLETRGKKRRNENLENTTDTQDRSIVPEPLLAFVKSECISDDDEESYQQQSDSENDSNQVNSMNDPVSQGRNITDSVDNSNEDDPSPRRKRQRIEENGSAEEHTRSTILQDDIHHTLKEEEIEIFDHPEEYEFDLSDEEESLKKDGYSSDPMDSNSSLDEEDVEISSSIMSSSDDSDEDTEMLLCLALLL